MTRQAHKGSFLVLEGPDDSRFWESRVPQTLCEIVIGGCKHSVIGAVQVLDRQAFTGVVGLVDDDCDRLRSISSPSPNIVYADTRDLEGLLLRSPAFFKILAEYGDRRKIERFEAQGEPVREALIRRALPLGRLRWLALVLGVEIDFKNLGVKRFLDTKTWTFDEHALMSIASQQSKILHLTQLQAEISKLTFSYPWLVCRGHDLVQMLGFGLEHVLGNRNPGEKSIGALLRAGLEEPEFTALQVYRDLRDWESANSPYRILS